MQKTVELRRRMGLLTGKTRIVRLTLSYSVAKKEFVKRKPICLSLLSPAKWLSLLFDKLLKTITAIYSPIIALIIKTGLAQSVSALLDMRSARIADTCSAVSVVYCLVL